MVKKLHYPIYCHTLSSLTENRTFLPKKCKKLQSMKYFDLGIEYEESLLSPYVMLHIETQNMKLFSDITCQIPNRWYSSVCLCTIFSTTLKNYEKNKDSIKITVTSLPLLTGKCIIYIGKNEEEQWTIFSLSYGEKSPYFCWKISRWIQDFLPDP